MTQRIADFCWWVFVWPSLHRLACQNLFQFCLKESIVRDAKVELFVVFFCAYQSIFIVKILLELRFIFLFILRQAVKNLNKCRFQLFCWFTHVSMGKQLTFGTLTPVCRVSFFETQLTRIIIFSEWCFSLEERGKTTEQWSCAARKEKDQQNEGDGIFWKICHNFVHRY